MELEKIMNSDTPTAESDHKPNNRGSAVVAAGGAARSYDCTFCKRGFTNAQALGGHMNIHRKDKTKGRRKNRVEDPLIENFNSSFLPQIAVADYGPILEERHVNSEVYTPPPNHGLQTGNYEYCFFPVWRPDNLQDPMDGNLSMRSDDDDDEVDLELRLGRLF